MTQRHDRWNTDGLTARILERLDRPSLDGIAKWIAGEGHSHRVDAARTGDRYRLDDGRIERTTDTLCTGIFSMSHGTIRGAAVIVWSPYPATLLTAIGGRDAGEVMEWDLLDGLTIIDATSHDAIDNLPARTRIRLDAPLRPLMPLLGVAG